MKKNTKNDFELLCDSLEKENNPIDDARKKVMEYVEEDYDKYLQLKAEAEETGYMEYVSTIVAIGAFMISVLNIFYDSITKGADDLLKMPQDDWRATCISYLSIIVIILIIAVTGVYPLVKSLKFRSVGKWRKYIRVVLEDMEEEAATWKE